MVDRLRAWYATPPSVEGVRPYTLGAMLDSTLQLYHALA
jgi:hypothetical protein